jgi:hypothetical protein
MPSLVFLATVLSLDVTRILVSLGYGLGYDSDAAASAGSGRFTGATQPSTGNAYTALAITGCTGNGVPVIVTTQYPHNVSSRGIGGLACIVSGITGNTAANAISTAPQDRTVGLNQGVLAVPVAGQPNQLALYAQDQGIAATGRLFPIIGNGAWTGGGTITPALTDGQILLGRDNVSEHSAPPRIVIVPRGIDRGPRIASTTNRARVAEQITERSQRLTGTDIHILDVHCWGQRLPIPDPAYDFDVVMALESAVKDSAYLLFGQSSEMRSGTWDDEKERATQMIKSGHLFTFGMTIHVPVLDNALGFVPGGTVVQSVVQSPTPQTAATINVTLS